MSKTAEEMANEVNENVAELKKKVDEAIEKAATPEQVQEAKDALEEYKKEAIKELENFVKSEDFEKVKTELKEANKEISSLKEGNNPKGVIDFKSAVSEALKEKHNEIKEFFKKNEAARSGSFEFRIKAPAVVATGNVTPTGAADIYAAQSVSGVSPYARTEMFLEQYLDVGNTDLASIPYVDEQPGEGDAAIVAEGSLKPLIDVDYVTAYSQPRKVAGRMKATEEALYDFGWLESAMTNTLKKKHDIARQNDLIGATNGINSIATPFNAAILGGVTVTNPQYYDAIAALVAGIANDSEGYYMPNVVFVNTLDNLKKMLTKDGNDNYIMPPFADAEGNIIEGVRVVAKPSIAAGTFVIGDFKNVKLRNLWGYTVRFGWENDDFGKNQITMIGESRYHLYATTNDRRGIISGNLADVVTAITPGP
ncbi:phage major capsid protein [Aquimarina macrocephali]|uniref:phage major capsid protein n=1 Tax=Aquimarina macrocephali TaxID=666563 RepID=UPI003F67FD53